MFRNTVFNLFTLFVAVPVLAFSANSFAGGEHAGGHGTEGHEMQRHRHDEWPTPPAGYTGKASRKWGNAAAIQRGRALYQKNCLSCHGASGTGNGPVAASLPHAPADLTHHFHRRPGKGDDYLFWRVSEGGAVEPFRGMQSTMPAFKSLLSEDDRWDVLSYVHAEFHKGFLEATPDDDMDRRMKNGN